MRAVAYVLMALVLGGAGVEAAQRVWTRSEILAIADQQAQALGYDPEQMSVSFDVYNSQWGEYSESQHGMTGLPDVKARLDGRAVWAVYYGPMSLQLGGDLWVFLDRQTGELVHTIQGQ